MKPRRALTLIALAVVFVTAGCTQVTTKSFRFLGAPEPPPTDPSQVEILRRPPVRRFEQLGRINAEPQGDDVDNEKIEAAIRKEAAKMDAEARRQMGRVIVGTAIKFGRE